jgi:DNA-directed RNA polymerase specialized sigma subunit, sigma54 homolog
LISEVDYEDDPDEFEPANIYSNQKINEDIPIEEQLDFLQNLSNQLSEFNLSEKEKDIAEEIVWNLDENGYLSLDIILIADRFNVTENDVEKVLFKVQKLNPPGIGARNLQECLLLQLNKKNQENHRKVIELHFNKFVNHNYKPIVNALGLKNKELENIIADIKKLNPYPGEGKIKNSNDAIIPDLIISFEKNEWKITINDSWITDLSINRDYLDMMGKNTTSKDTKLFLNQKFDSAYWVIKAIEQRHKTLTSV